MTPKQIAGYLKARRAQSRDSLRGDSFGGIGFNDGYNVPTFGITKAAYDAINRAMHDEYGMAEPSNLTSADVKKALKNHLERGGTLHHATKKKPPAQLQREIDEALSGRSKYHLTPSSPKKLFRYTKSELEAMPTISSGQMENLKVEGDVDGIPTRWWLTRMTVEDGETHAVHVEQLIDGSWQEVHKYGRADRH